MTMRLNIFCRVVPMYHEHSKPDYLKFGDGAFATSPTHNTGPFGVDTFDTERRIAVNEPSDRIVDVGCLIRQVFQMRLLFHDRSDGDRKVFVDVTDHL